MKAIYLVLLLILFPAAVSAESLVINVAGVKPGQGDVRIAVFNAADEFPKGSYFKAEVAAGDAETIRIVVEGLKPGEYAIAVFQDIDGSGELDTNWIGIPKEPYGFSGKWKSGGASFKDAVIELGPAGSDIVIKMK